MSRNDGLAWLEAAEEHQGGPLPEELRQRVFLERIALYYRSLSAAIGAVVVNSALLAFLLLDTDSETTLLLWFAAIVVLSLGRAVSVYVFNHQNDEQRQRNVRRWYLDMLIGTALSGFIWGAAGWLFYDSSDMLDQFVLAIVLAGMAAGAIVSLSPFREASSVFLALILLPFTLRSIGEQTEAAIVMAIMVLFYLSMLLLFSRRVHQTVLNGLEMQYMRSRAERTVEFQALFDELTGLPNRRLLQDRLAQTHAYVKRSGGHAALLFLDLDHFKRVNDSLGHAVGDKLLEEVAHRLRSFMRSDDTAARLGGDEFIVLMGRIHGDEEHVLSAVQRRGEELRRSIERPMNIRGNEIHISASIGVSLLPGHTEDTDDLLKHADTAMYQAKDDGRNTLRFFASDMQETLERRMSLERRLRGAIDNDEFELFLQPQYRQDHSVCGAELLLRWRHEGKLIAPDEFIPVAEDCGLIYRIGDWVVEEACRIGRELLDDVGDRDFSLALNVSPRQFQHKNFTDTVYASLVRHQLPPGLIELEITEGLLIEDSESAAEKMHFLRDKGLRFSIDDFGTGYSSLSYLKALPLDALKIDGSFICDVLEDEAHASIVLAILSMARSLELEVIAEGVENADVHRFLTEAGCPRFQGYHYSLPVCFDDFRALLAEHAKGGEAVDSMAVAAAEG